MRSRAPRAAAEALAREAVPLGAAQPVEGRVRLEDGEVVGLCAPRKVAPRRVRLRARLERREEGRAARERRGDGERLVEHVEARAEQDELPEPRVERQLREQLAERREALGVRERAEPLQRLDRRAHGLGRGWLRQLGAHLGREARELQRLGTHHELLERHTTHLRLRVRIEPLVGWVE
eukprot:6442088-Prymnesium_polylepis.1